MTDGLLQIFKLVDYLTLLAKLLALMLQKEIVLSLRFYLELMRLKTHATISGIDKVVFFHFSRIS